MALMQGPESLMWFLLTVLFTVLACAFTWYLVVTGRDRAPRRQRKGQSTIVKYGDIEEDRAPVSKFLMWTYVGVGVWSIGYLIWTGFRGTT